MSTSLTAPQPLAEEIERVLVQGDIGKLTPDQRMDYYRNMCASLGLNPMTRPFEYLTLQGKTLLYAKKDATDQLRKIHGVSINIVSRETIDGVYVVTARATDAKGRQDESLGALPLPGSPVERANAIMKCETKAKRRVTLSICGLGMLDETELETIGSKEAQAQYLASKNLEPYVSDKKLPPVSTVPDATIRELADELDKPPQISDIERRQAVKDAEARDAIKPIDGNKGKSGAHGIIRLEKLKDWKALKDEIRSYTGTDDIYKSVLQSKGYAHANEIQTEAHARSIWAVLGAERNRLKLRDENIKVLEAASEVIGARAFANCLGIHGAETIEDALALSGDAWQALLGELKDLVDARKASSV